MPQRLCLRLGCPELDFVPPKPRQHLSLGHFRGRRLREEEGAWPPPLKPRQRPDGGDQELQQLAGEPAGGVLATEPAQGGFEGSVFLTVCCGSFPPLVSFVDACPLY